MQKQEGMRNDSKNFWHDQGPSDLLIHVQDDHSNFREDIVHCGNDRLFIIGAHHDILDLITTCQLDSGGQRYSIMSLGWQVIMVIITAVDEYLL